MSTHPCNQCSTLFSPASEARHPTTQLPCCSRYIHDLCLAKSFACRHNHLCPFCEAALWPHNNGVALPNVEPGGAPYNFTHLPYDPIVRLQTAIARHIMAQWGAKLLGHF